MKIQKKNQSITEWYSIRDTNVEYFSCRKVEAVGYFTL